MSGSVEMCIRSEKGKAPSLLLILYTVNPSISQHFYYIGITIIAFYYVFYIIIVTCFKYILSIPLFSNVADYLVKERPIPNTLVISRWLTKNIAI